MAALGMHSELCPNHYGRARLLLRWTAGQQRHEWECHTLDISTSYSGGHSSSSSHTSLWLTSVLSAGECGPQVAGASPQENLSHIFLKPLGATHSGAFSQSQHPLCVLPILGPEPHPPSAHHHWKALPSLSRLPTIVCSCPHSPKSHLGALSTDLTPPTCLPRP